MRFLFLLLFVACASGAWASDSVTYKRKTYRIRLKTTSDSLVMGYLNLVGDSSVRITAYPLPYGIPLPAERTYEISYRAIDILQLWRKGRVGRGLLFGSLAGGAAGAAVGAATYQKPDCTYFCLDFGPGFAAFAGGIMGFLGGGLIGTITGAVSKSEYSIGGIYESFVSLKEAMDKKVINRLP